MKAIRIHQFGGPEAMKLEELPDPSPARGQVAIDVQAAGVNPVDTYIRSGLYGERPMPWTLGMDASGTIKKVGEGVTTFRPGDRVYVTSPSAGAYADQIICDVAKVFSLPENFSFKEGAAVGVPYATAYFALFHRGRAMAGETVLIHGASGGVGTAAVQLARSRGLRVIGTGGTDKGRELVRNQGAHLALDHKAPDYLDELMKWTDGKGVNLVIEMLANANLAKDLKVLARHGRVVVVGSRGKVEIDPRDAMTRLADIRGLALLVLNDEELRPVHAGLRGAFESCAVKPVIGKEFPLAQAAKAHEAILAPGAFGKILLIP